MGIETIEKRLQERFDAPLKEYYERHIVFWKDEDGRFENDIDDISLNGVKIIKLKENNFFEVKKLLLCDDTKSNYLVYDTCKYEKLSDRWLYDIELYSGEPFFADKSSLVMDEFSIEQTPQMKSALKLYPKFFDSKERCEKLKAISNGNVYTNPATLHYDILSVLTSSEKNTAQSIIGKVLIDYFIYGKSAIENIEKFGNEAVFWTMIQKNTGYIKADIDNNFEELLSHIIFTASIQNMAQAVLKPFEKHISLNHSSFCYTLIHDMTVTNENDAFELCKIIEDKYNLKSKFAKVDISNLVSCDIFPCIDEVILTKFFDEVNSNVIKSDNIVSTVEKRKVMSWYKDYENYYNGIFFIAKMQQFYHEHLDSFHLANAYDVFKSYTNDFYKMDSLYRQFHLAFSKSLISSYAPDLDDLYKSSVDYIEQLYQNWYLKELTNLWFKVADTHLSGENIDCNIKKQIDFYDDFVLPIKEKRTVFVIISDALRYEVAVELCDNIAHKSRASVEISAMQSVFPSVTKYGMAALLPGSNKKVSDGVITVDNLKCSSTDERKKVLCAHDENSTAVQYKDFIKMKKSDRSELIKGKKVVYIYHNTIDAIAEKPATQTKVFDACDDAISEITNLAGIIAGLRGSSEVIITSDHGFTYTYLPFKESQKISVTDLAGVKASGRRYIIGDESTNCDYLMNIDMQINDESKSLKGYSSLDIVRIKQSGDGENFVHGGMSLQECVVPVIKVKNVRLDSKKYQNNKEMFDTTPVEITLLSQNHKISNNIFSLYFFQKEPVGKNKKAQTYQLYFIDDFGNRISDIHKIIADKEDIEATNRQYRVNFCLKEHQFNRNDDYYLIIENENGEEISRIKYEIDIVFSAEDFGF